MSGFYIPIELGVCEALPEGKKDRGVWGFRKVTIPARTPPDQILAVATSRYIDKCDTFVYKTWVQGVGKEVEIEDEDIPTSESEEE